MTAKLCTILESYVLSRTVATSSRLQLGYAVKRFGEFLGHEATTADLVPDVFNKWVAGMQAGELEPRTVRNYRASILTLWKDAYDSGETDEIPRRLRKVKVNRKLPEAWTADEIRRLLDEVAKIEGRFQRSRVPRAGYWKTFILLAYDTGLRLGDLRALPTADVLGKDTFTVTQHKTGIPIVCRLRPETVEAVSALYPPDRPKLFGGVLSRVKTMTGLKALAIRAGLPVHNGVSRRLRRSAVTYLEAAHPGTGMRFLGHATPGLAHRSYIDPRITGLSSPLPPSLVSAGLQGLISPSMHDAPTLDEIQDVLTRALENTRVEAKTIDVACSPLLIQGPAEKGVEVMPLVEEYLAGLSYGPGGKATIRSYLRAALETLEMWNVGQLSGARMVEYMRLLRTNKRASGTASRDMMVAFLKWLILEHRPGFAANECLGALTAAKDLGAGRVRYDGKRNRKGVA